MLIVSTQRYELKALSVRENSLIYVLRGQKRLIGSQKTYICKPGQAIAIGAGLDWNVVNDPAHDGRYEALALSFSEQVLAQFHQLYPPGSAPKVPRAQVLKRDEQLSETLLRLSATGRDDSISPAVASHRTLELLLLLAERGVHFAAPGEQQWADRIRQLVHHQPQETWGLKELAAHFHMSPSSLQRKLAESRITVAELVRQTRLELALFMLQTQSLSVGEVAQQCGWESHSRFSAIFKGRWGVLPSQVKAT